MPRSRAVRPKEIQAVMTPLIQRLVDAAQTPGGRRNLKKYAAALVEEWHMCQFVLNIQRIVSSRRQRRDLMRLNLPVKFFADIGRFIRTSDDLRLYEASWSRAASFCSGEAPATGFSDVSEPTFSPDVWGRYLQRIGLRTEKPPKHKSEFRQAYEAREKARSHGRRVTQKELAQQFMPSAYDAKPDSAVRSMGRGLKRIERDKAFIPSDHTNNG